MRHRGQLIGTIVLSTGLVAAAASAPAVAGAGHSAHHKGTRISTVKTGLGRVVSNSKGRVMFRFLKDGHNKSRCNRTCRSVWPPVMTSAKPRAGSHIHGSHLGRTKKGQVSYYGHPLYYYSLDPKPGKTHGDGLKEFGAHWYVVSPTGKSVKPKHSPNGGATSAAEVGSGTVGATAVITNGADGHTLYELVPNERPNFWCTGSCTATWPPLLTKGSPSASGDAMSTKLGTVKRPDGSTQVTYDGFPVYEYSGDSAAGQGNGHGIPGPYFNTWYDINPDGSHN